VLTRATKSTIACFDGPSFHEGSWSSLLGFVIVSCVVREVMEHDTD